MEILFQVVDFMEILWMGREGEGILFPSTYDINGPRGGIAEGHQRDNREADRTRTRRRLWGEST